METITKCGFQGTIWKSKLLCTQEALEVNATLSVPRYYETDTKAFRQVADCVRDRIKLSTEELHTKFTAAEAALDGIRSEVDSLAVRWMEAAAEYLSYSYAQDIQSVQYPASTGNVWVPDEQLSGGRIYSEHISNHAFWAGADIVEEAIKKRRHRPCTVWYASYYLAVNLERHEGLLNGHIIKSIDRKRFTDKGEAFKYIAGRKDALSSTYFSSLDPVIPADLRQLFLLHGVELPGYNYAPASNTEVTR